MPRPSQLSNVGRMPNPAVRCSGILYWCLDQHKCIAGIWLVPINEIINGCIKWLVRRARPGWISGKVQMLGWSSEYSFPSSHSQLSAAVMHFFVRASSSTYATSVTPAWLAYAFAAAVALSRVHVGLHFPSDVVVGAGLGLFSSAVYELLLPVLYRLAPARALTLLAALSTPGLLLALAVRCAYLHACRSTDPPGWSMLARRGKYKERM